jgi:hypothetical protein
MAAQRSRRYSEWRALRKKVSSDRVGLFWQLLYASYAHEEASSLHNTAGKRRSFLDVCSSKLLCRVTAWAAMLYCAHSR